MVSAVGRASGCSTTDALRAGVRPREPGEGIGGAWARRTLSLGERPPLPFF
jgi:hypothetical protein